LASAKSTAGKVHGKYAVYYALEKPPLGGGAIPAMLHNSFTRNGTNGPVINLEAMGKDRALGGLGKLSPEQQVQRARQMKEAKDAAK